MRQIVLAALCMVCSGPGDVGAFYAARLTSDFATPSRPSRVSPYTKEVCHPHETFATSTLLRPSYPGLPRRGGPRPGLSLSMRGAGGSDVPTGSRVLATLPYLLPVLDGIENGRFLFKLLPEVGNVIYTVLAPPLALWEHVPFLPLATFILLTVVARQPVASRFVRFNIQQAILVDVGLLILGLLNGIIGALLPLGSPAVTNFSFYCLCGAVLYACVEILRGRLPNQIPLISAAAEMQIGPY